MLKRILTFTICLLFLSSIANAWLAGYGYRKKITIQGANLDANVTHFPLLISIVDANIDDHCDDDGDRSFDIRFTQSDDSELDINWEDYSEAGGNATIIAWVSDAGWTIQSDGSTEIYLYYGNAAAGDPGTDAGVWDADFMAVYHMMNLTDTTIEDFAGTNNGTKKAINEPLETAVQIYKSQEFDSTDDGINLGNDASLQKIDSDNAWTLTAWLNSDDPTTAGYWLFKDASWVFDVGDQANEVRLQERSTWTRLETNDDPIAAADTWYHVAFTCTGEMTNGAIYVNAVASGLTITGTTWDGTTDDMQIGRTNNALTWDGELDEIRISDIVRAVAWLKFEYHNMFQGDNELTWGAEEEEPSDFIPKVIIIR